VSAGERLSNPLVRGSSPFGRAANQDNSAANSAEPPSKASTVSNPSAVAGTPEVHAAEPCRIPLGHGVYALVDADDYPAISAHTWHLKRKRNDPHRRYAQRTISLGKGHNPPKTARVMHRQIMGVTDPKVLVDHRNGDGLDNRRSNLRLTDARGNTTNVVSSKLRKAGGYKGVSWNKGAGKWQVSICGGEPRPNGKRKQLYLGLFTDPAAAARAYDAKAIEVFGEFAALNFPRESEAAHG
jgi:hypothetical protein